MALQGSLDDVALRDVLQLLSSTAKTGELRIDGGSRGRGRLWLSEGQVVASEGGGGDAVDVLFELLRLAHGTFLFTAGVPADAPSAPRAVAPLLEEAEARLREWREIEAVVPSVSASVALVAQLAGASVTVDAATWPVLVAVATGGTVAAVAESLGLGEFAACRAVKGLVDGGLARVDATAAGELARSRRRRTADDDAALPAGDPAPVAHEPAASERFAAALREMGADPGEPSVETTVAGQVLTAEEVAAAGEAGLIDENGEPINRSLLLKFLSSVRS